MRKLPPLPKGPLGPNPDNALVRSAGEAVEQEPHHQAVHAVSRRAKLDGLRHAASLARAEHDYDRAEDLDAEVAALEERAP